MRKLLYALAATALLFTSWPMQNLSSGLIILTVTLS